MAYLLHTYPNKMDKEDTQVTIYEDKLKCNSVNCAIVDDNQDGSNERTAHPGMARSMAVHLREPQKSRKSRVRKTWILSKTANLIVRMTKSRRLNQLVPRSRVLRCRKRRKRRPSRRPSEERPSTDSNESHFIKPFVAMMVLFVFVLVFVETSRIMICLNCQLQTDQAEEPIWLEQSEKCVLPAYPEHGFFIMSNAPDAKPGESFESLKLTVNCLPGYRLVGAETVICLNGFWSNSIPKCVHLMIGGRPPKLGEMPWLVGIYRKDTKPYMQICGGSLVSTSRVISAAHCFWDDVSKQLPASQFAVAAGKIYRPWNNPRDVHAQKSDVKDIKIPPRFQGAATNFQDDVAVILLETAFVYTPFVGPAKLPFIHTFNQRKLQLGKLGKVAGWGLTAENGNASQILKVAELRYVDIQQCIAESPLAFQPYITSDKICACYENGTALCRSDSGSGLVFAELGGDTDHYYLLGVASTAPTNGERCNSNAATTFTYLEIHKHFIREHLSSGGSLSNF